MQLLEIGIMLASDTKRLHLGMSVQEIVEHDYTISNHSILSDSNSLLSAKC